MKTLVITRKLLLELWREPLLWVLLFVFPIVFLWLYDVAFGQTEQGLGRFLKIMVLNQDDSAPGLSASYGESLIQVLAAVEYEGQPVFEISRIHNPRVAEIAVRERKAALLMIIPADFSQAILQATRNEAQTPASQPASIQLVGDPGSDNFVFAHSYLEGLVHDFVQFSAGWQPSQTITYEFIPGTGTSSDFDYGVPGLIIFGLMLLAASTALILVREDAGGTLRRLRLTPMQAGELLAGVMLSQMVLAVAIVPVTFGASVALGFQSQGSLFLAMGVGLLVSLSAVGIGLLTACVTRTESEAANLSASLGVMLVLLCDALYPVPEAPIATLFGRTIQVYDLLPTAHAAEALRRVLILGEGASSIRFEIGALALLSTLFFLVGLGFFWKLKMHKG